VPKTVHIFTRANLCSRAHNFFSKYYNLAGMRRAILGLHSQLCIAKQSRARLAARLPPPPVPSFGLHELKALRAFVLNNRQDRAAVRVRKTSLLSVHEYFRATRQQKKEKEMKRRQLRWSVFLGGQSNRDSFHAPQVASIQWSSLFLFRVTRQRSCGSQPLRIS